MVHTVTTGQDSQATAKSSNGERWGWLWPSVDDVRGLHWTHWLVIALTLAATLAVAHAVKDQNGEINKLRFTRETELIVDQFREQLKRYEDVLWAGVGAIHTRKGSVTRKEWAVFTKSLRLDERYPAITRLGLIRSVPAADLAEFAAQQQLTQPGYTVFPPFRTKLHFPVQFIEPRENNAAPVGLDGAAEPHRRHAIQRARDSGRAQISEPIALGVPDEVEGRAPAVAVYVPFYAEPEVPAPGERMRLFKGVVAAPIALRHMLRGEGEGPKNLASFSVSDGQHRLFDDRRAGWTGHDDNPLYTLSSTIEMWGRPWTFDFSSTLMFRQEATDHQPLFILAGGGGIVALLLILFIVLTRAGRKSKHYVSRLSQLTAALRNKADALEDSNAELERFACIVAHDLKSPLGSIGLLCDCVEEDLAESPAARDIPTEVTENLGRVQAQIIRMRDLIDGVMRYSSHVARSRTVDDVDTRKLITEIGESLELAPGELMIVGGLPVLQTSRIQLQQVLENLIGNAFKYHPKREEARVLVWVEDLGDFHRFHVRDNGAGIDPRFHESVFEMFQTVPSNGREDSTGVGLAIVKRTVESAGGEVSIDSSAGTGATFRFTWPVSNPVDLAGNDGPVAVQSAAASGQQPSQGNEGIRHAA